MQQPKKQCTRTHMDPSLVSQLSFSVCASFILLANFSLRTRLLATSASCFLFVCMLSLFNSSRKKQNICSCSFSLKNLRKPFDWSYLGHVTDCQLNQSLKSGPCSWPQDQLALFIWPQAIITKQMCSCEKMVAPTLERRRVEIGRNPSPKKAGQVKQDHCGDNCDWGTCPECFLLY